MTARRWLMVAVGAAALLLIVGRSLAGVYADYLWYDAIGAAALWRTRLAAIIGLRAGAAIAAGLFAFANLYAVRQSVVSLVFPRRLGNLEIGEEVPSRYLMTAAVVLSALLGVLLAVPHSDWTTLVLAMSGTSFQEVDPYFTRDLSFFVSWLPFEAALWTWAFLCVAAVGVTVVLLYALTPSLKWQRGSLYASAYVRRHCTVLAGLLLLLLAWSFRLDMYSLATDGSGLDGAFSYVDHRVGLPGDVLLGLVTVGSGLIVIWAGFVGQFRLAGIAALTVVTLSLAVRQVAPFVVQHMGTDAERAARERPYLATRAGYTRRAFAVDAIGRADSTIAYPSVQAALPWVSAWDPGALARAIDAGRSGIDRGVRAAWRATPAGLVADVVDPPSPGASPGAPWTVARILAAGADDRGGPLRVAGANASIMDDLPLDAPLVYPGATPFAMISDSLSHTTGTSLESWWARLANAWSLQTFHILGGDLPQPRPTIVSHRDIRDRVDRVAPFFVQGRHIDPILVGDSLYWSVDLYSTSDTYPLSRHITLAGAERAYLHHAGVAIVQASTGDISVVPDSALDPIAAMWVRRLPSIFGAWSALPTGIRALLAPPIDGIYAQATAFGRYGTSADNVVARHVPTIDGADTSLTGDDLPLVLPGSQTTAVVLPLVDETDRVRGLLIGTGGGTRLTTWYPLANPGPRWPALLDRLRSADSAGATAREGPLARGRVRVVPLRDGVAYLQPTYRWRPQSIPALNRVSILVGDTTRSIVPSGSGAHGPESAPAAREGAGSAAALYNAMRDALRRGDWTAFGKAFEALGRALGQTAAKP